MKILTWNINGIRAPSGKPSVTSGVCAAGNALKLTLDSLQADIICLQETKVTRDQLEEGIALIDGYESFFAFSRGRSGYSGVATYCRNGSLPVRAEEGLTPFYKPPSSDGIGCYGDMEVWSEAEQALVDGEGRAVLTEHRLTTISPSTATVTTGCTAGVSGGGGDAQCLVVINVYCPRAHQDEEQRYEYKMLFYQALELRCRALRKAGKHVIVLGDVNCSHHLIDVCDADNYCTPEEFMNAPSRQWLNKFIIDTHAKDAITSTSPAVAASKSLAGSSSDNSDVDGGMHSRQSAVDNLTDYDEFSLSQSVGVLVDTFRYFHPSRQNAYTCWSTVTGARKTNFGTRIDYILADEDFVKRYAQAGDIMPEIEGSDHCPVYLEVGCSVNVPSSAPSLAASRMPEFSGKQQTMKSFLTRIKSGSSALAAPVQTSGKATTTTTVLPSSHPPSNRQATLNLKRPPSTPVGGSDLKRACSSGHQSSIAGFFQRKNATTSTASNHQSLAANKPSDVPVSAPAADTAPVIAAKSASSQSQLVSPETKASSGAQWKSLFSSRAPKPSLCRGHREPCVLQTVKKSGPNQFRRFYVCARPAGSTENPEARCGHFEWIDKPKFKPKSGETPKS